MASVSASTLIIFIAAITVALGVSGAMIDSVSGISDSIDDRSLDVKQQIDTDVEIISDPGSTAVARDVDSDGTDEVVVLVKNTGQGTLVAEADALDVLYDGQYVAGSDVRVTVVDGSTWREGNVARVVVERAPASGETHRITVIVNDEEETLEFHVA